MRINMKEIWKDVKGYENIYQVSNLGRMKSLDRYIKGSRNVKFFKKGKILTLNILNSGYNVIMLHKNNKVKLCTVHRLVAKTFIPNPKRKPQINHKDGNKLNNNVNNLEWVTQSENNKHAYKNGMMKPTNQRQVYQIDIETNEVIKEWESISEASRSIEKTVSCIYYCCKKKINSCGGYKWEYVKKGK